jgi:hypothetical protein
MRRCLIGGKSEGWAKTWAIIKQQWGLGSRVMQYNVYAFGGHPVLLAPIPGHLLRTLDLGWLKLNGAFKEKNCLRV